MFHSEFHVLQAFFVDEIYTLTSDDHFGMQKVKCIFSSNPFKIHNVIFKNVHQFSILTSNLSISLI